MRSGKSTGKANILNELVKRYWRPLYAYVRSKGYEEHEAEDIVQSFLVDCLKHDLFGRARQERGRFRTFLRTSCDHFMSNYNRAQRAKRRRPAAGFVSLDEPAGQGEERRAIEPGSSETPERVFDRVWAREFLHRILRMFREECGQSGKRVHHEIFEDRIVRPALEGASPPSLRDLAVRHGIDEKTAANCLITARRAFQRLLRREVSSYALSDEDVTAEINDLFSLLAPAGA